MNKASFIATESAAACKEIQDGMLEACRNFAAKNGLSIESAGWRGPQSASDVAFHVSFRVTIAALNGKPTGLDKEIASEIAGYFGLKPTDIGREFSARGERFRIIGIDPRRPKYPISAERLSNHQYYKFPADQVVKLLEGEAKA